MYFDATLSIHFEAYLQGDVEHSRPTFGATACHKSHLSQRRWSAELTTQPYFFINLSNKLLDL